MAIVRASEGLHWYTRDGVPAYSVMGANGKERPATLRDARKLNLVPSVTNIIRCAAAPGLERWKLDQMLHAALTLPRGSMEPEADWISRVWTDSGETAKKAAQKGVDVHAAIQGHYEGMPLRPDFAPIFMDHIKGAVAAVNNWKGVRNDWRAEVSFAHPMGFGGKTDLHCSVALLDFKSKEFDENTDLRTWDEHAMQLAANREGQGIPNAPCAIVYVSVTNPGLSRLIEIPEEELERGWECFTYLLGFWKAKNKYRCVFDLPERQAA